MNDRIFITNLYRRKKVIKKDPGPEPSVDRLTLDYVENMSKAFHGDINLLDENNAVAGTANVDFIGFCNYTLADNTNVGSAGMYKVSLNLNGSDKIGQVLHTDNNVKTLYYQKRGNAVSGERPMVNGLATPDITESGDETIVNTYVVTAENGNVSYNKSDAHWGPAATSRILEIFDSAVGRSAGLIQGVTVGGHKRWRSLKTNITVYFVMLS